MLISSDIWVAALIRRAEQGGAFATVARRGDARAGAVLVKVVNRRLGETRLYAQALRGEGEQIWMEPQGTRVESELDAYIARSAQRDPDLWVVEVEDQEGRSFITEPVENR